MVVSVFGIEVNTNLFIAPLLRDKNYKASEFSPAILNKQSMTLLKAQTLIGFLSF